jgi:anti-anti-sigma factor
MELDMIDVGDDVMKLVLKGRLDAPGVDRIETPFSAAAASGGRHAVVDLSGVTFAASMAIRLFISVGRAKAGRGRKFILYGAQPPVREVLDHAGLAELIPIVADEAAALRAAAG